MTKVLLGGAALAALIAIAPASAQSGQPAPAAQAPRMQHGAGHSRAQLGIHVATMFQRLDSDRDGVITRAESEAAQGYRGERRADAQERRAKRSSGQRTETRAALFDRLDANRDGSISRAEFTAAPALREQRQAARSGPQGERRAERGARGMMGAKGTSLRGHMFDMADANRDGQITPDERMQMRQRMRGAKTNG